MTRSPTARSFEYWLRSSKPAWRASLLSSVLNPVLYLAALGVGLGALVDRSDPGGLDGVAYLTFVAPGLLAATGMQIAAGEAGQPVRSAVQFTKAYHAMLATPLDVRDVLRGHLLWILLRVGTSCVIYAGVAAAFGAFHSPWALLALPVAVLTGMAFAAPIAAFAVTQDRDLGFAVLSRFGIVPMFMFSGTFFPIDDLPGAIELVAYVTPLWHGVDLARDLCLGTPGLGSALRHAGYLGLWVLAGTAVAAITFRRRLRV
jgi:lipooligosaccharide transport system permease protein